MSALANYIYCQSYSMRIVLTSFIHWLINSFPDQDIYEFGEVISKLEKQTLYCNDARLFILNLFQRVWTFLNHRE